MPNWVVVFEGDAALGARSEVPFAWVVGGGPSQAVASGVDARAVRGDSCRWCVGAEATTAGLGAGEVAFVVGRAAAVGGEGRGDAPADEGGAFAPGAPYGVVLWFARFPLR